MSLTLIGAAIGILGSFALTRLLTSQLLGVGASDWRTFVTVTVVLIGSAAAATLHPPLTATRLDPAVTLHEE